MHTMVYDLVDTVFINLDSNPKMTIFDVVGCVHSGCTCSGQSTNWIWSRFGWRACFFNWLRSV